MEEQETKFDIVIGDNLVKYSPYAFGSAFANVQYFFDKNIMKTNKNFEDYFKIYGPLIDETGKEHKFKSVTTFTDSKSETLYHINFK